MRQIVTTIAAPLGGPWFVKFEGCLVALTIGGCQNYFYFLLININLNEKIILNLNFDPFLKPVVKLLVRGIVGV